MRYLLFVMVILSSCHRETCDDGIMNQDELGVDCGGICIACADCHDGVQNGNETGTDCGGSCPACPTCSDGVMNGDETGLDCGGSNCQTCPQRMRAYVQGILWNATHVSAYMQEDKLIIQGSDQQAGIALTHDSPLSTGSWSLSGYDAVLTTDSGQFICVAVNGSLSITAYDDSVKYVSGSFSFPCEDISGGGSCMVTQGTFSHVRF